MNPLEMSYFSEYELDKMKLPLNIYKLDKFDRRKAEDLICQVHKEHPREIVHLKNDAGEIYFYRPGLPPFVHLIIKGLGHAYEMDASGIDHVGRTYTDITDPMKCNKHPSDLKFLYEECRKRGLLKELFSELLNHKESYLIGQFSELIFSPLEFKECMCCGSGAFNRFKANRRSNLEDAVIAHVEENCEKNERVTVLSLGCGGLLQEWMILGRLIEKGYTKFHLRLIDPKLNSNKLKKFTNFFSELPGIDVTTEASRYTPAVYSQFESRVQRVANNAFRWMGNTLIKLPVLGKLLTLPFRTIGAIDTKKAIKEYQETHKETNQSPSDIYYFIKSPLHRFLFKISDYFGLNPLLGPIVCTDGTCNKPFSTKYDVVLAVDFDDIFEPLDLSRKMRKKTTNDKKMDKETVRIGWDDIWEVKNQLKTSGKLFLGYGGIDSVLSENGESHFLHMHKHIKTLVKNLKENLQPYNKNIKLIIDQNDACETAIVVGELFKAGAKTVTLETTQNPTSDHFNHLEKRTSEAIIRNQIAREHQEKLFIVYPESISEIKEPEFDLTLDRTGHNWTVVDSESKPQSG